MSLLSLMKLLNIWLIQSLYMSWMKGFLVFQSPIALGSIIAITIIRIWSKGRNRVLEYLLLIVSIVGAKPFHDINHEDFFLSSIIWVRWEISFSEFS